MASFDPFPCDYYRCWKAKVPPRVAFFSWTAALGRLLTIDNFAEKKSYPYRLVLYVQEEW
jgi:hypothetical protein